MKSYTLSVFCIFFFVVDVKFIIIHFLYKVFIVMKIKKNTNRVILKLDFNIDGVFDTLKCYKNIDVY